MEKEKVTIESIMVWFKTAIEEKHPVSIEQWLDGAGKLNILAEDIDNEIAMLEADMKFEECKLIEADVPASKANVLKIKAVNYKEYLKKKALKDRITEHIRIAKQRTQIPNL